MRIGRVACCQEASDREVLVISYIYMYIYMCIYICVYICVYIYICVSRIVLEVRKYI